METAWHFPFMIIASFLLLFIIIRIVIGKNVFKEKRKHVTILAVLVIIVGMLFGKYGANFGFPWWIYYPIPMLMNVLLPPLVLKMNTKMTFQYIILSFLSAPVIHLLFSLFGWTEYMPFWTVFS